MRGLSGHAFNAVQHGLQKGGGVGGGRGGLCADIHGQVNGLGNRYIFFFPLEFSD